MSSGSKLPSIVKFKQVGDSSIGFISIAEGNILPFEVKRVFWTYYTPNDVQRGGHAHEVLEEIITAVSGTVTVATELQNGETQTFTLDSPNIGLFLPPNYWRTLQFSHNAVLLTMASIEYEQSEYIRDYNEFRDGS